MTTPEKPIESDKVVQQETLTADKLQQQLPPPKGDEFTETTQQEDPGIDIIFSEFLPLMVTTLVFGGVVAKSDGTALTAEERAAAFQQQSTLILKVIGFDAAVENIIPGATTDINPMYVIGGGVAAMLGLAFLLRPPKPKKEEKEKPAE